MMPTQKIIQIKEGFYPSIIYLSVFDDIKNQQHFKQIQNILASNHIQHQIVDPFHISLTKNFYPVFSQIQSLANQSKKAVSSGIIKLPITLLFKSVKILQNFITLTVQKFTQEQLKLIAQQFTKITKIQFYQNPIFHVSLFKVLSQISEELLNQLQSVKISPKKSMRIEKCHMKSGKIVYNLNK